MKIEFIPIKGVYFTYLSIHISSFNYITSDLSESIFNKIADNIIESLLEMFSKLVFQKVYLFISLYIL